MFYKIGAVCPLCGYVQDLGKIDELKVKDWDKDIIECPVCNGKSDFKEWQSCKYPIKENNNVYVLERQDDYNYDEYVEQTIVAETEERAIELANKEYGVWGISKKVDLNIEQVLTKDFNAG